MYIYIYIYIYICMYKESRSLLFAFCLYSYFEKTEREKSKLHFCIYLLNIAIFILFYNFLKSGDY